MALDPNAFSPDSANNQQSNLRRQKMSALLGGKASLSSLFNGESDAGDTTDGLSKSAPGGEAASPLATPGLGAAEPAGSPSLLASERVPTVPNFAGATPLLTGEQQAGAELGEAERGEEGVIGGGPGRQGLSTGDRNKALMSFFHPQPTQTMTPQGASDTMKAIGSAMSAKNVAGKAKRLFGGSGPAAEHDPALSLDRAGAALSGPDSSGLTAADRLTAADAEFGPAEGSGFSMPDLSKLGTYGQGLGLLGSAAGLAGKLSGNQDLGTAGQAAGAAGSAIKAGDTLSSGGSIGGGASGVGDYIGPAVRLGTGAMDIANAKTDRQKAAQALQTVGMTLADFYTGGLSELGPMLGGFIGQDNPIGAMLTGFPALMNPGVDVSHYDRVRDAANLQGQHTIEGLSDLAGHVPANDLGATWRALAASQGHVRSYFTPPDDVAQQLGIAKGTGWDQMTPQQFQGAMNWLKEDPARLSAITGTGDIGYLNQGDAQGYADKAAGVARQLVARQLGLPYSGGLQSHDNTYNPWGSEDDPAYAAMAQGNAANEQAFMDQSKTWSAAHPGVTLAPFTPSWTKYAQPKNRPALMDLYSNAPNSNTL